MEGTFPGISFEARKGRETPDYDRAEEAAHVRMQQCTLLLSCEER